MKRIRHYFGISFLSVCLLVFSECQKSLEIEKPVIADSVSESATVTDDTKASFKAGSVYIDNLEMVRGIFSVSPEKRIKFSKGNLWMRTSGSSVISWHCEKEQFSFRTVPGEMMLLNSSYTICPDADRGLFLINEIPSALFYMNSIQQQINERNLVPGGCNQCLRVKFQMIPGGRLLKDDEGWGYLLNRSNSIDGNFGKLRGIGKIVLAGEEFVKGLIILPDGPWYTPSGVSTTPRFGQFTCNTYTVDEWHLMENKGAVFLPLAGYNYFGYFGWNTTGYYWTSTKDLRGNPVVMSISSSNESAGYVLGLQYVFTSKASYVRLVTYLND